LAAKPNALSLGTNKAHFSESTEEEMAVTTSPLPPSATAIHADTKNSATIVAGGDTLEQLDQKLLFVENPSETPQVKTKSFFFVFWLS